MAHSSGGSSPWSSDCFAWACGEAAHHGERAWRAKLLTSWARKWRGRDLSLTIPFEGMSPKIWGPSTSPNLLKVSLPPNSTTPMDQVLNTWTFGVQYLNYFMRSVVFAFETLDSLYLFCWGQFPYPPPPLLASMWLIHWWWEDRKGKEISTYWGPTMPFPHPHTVKPLFVATLWEITFSYFMYHKAWGWLVSWSASLITKQ